MNFSGTYVSGSLVSALFELLGTSLGTMFDDSESEEAVAPQESDEELVDMSADIRRKLLLAVVFFDFKDFSSSDLPPS